MTISSTARRELIDRHLVGNCQMPKSESPHHRGYYEVYLIDRLDVKGRHRFLSSQRAQSNNCNQNLHNVAAALLPGTLNSTY